jgi:type I restriction enzyme, S subunit
VNEHPPGWATASIEELAGTGGLVTDGDWIESKDQDPAGDVRLIQLADIGVAEFRDRSARFLTTAKAAELGCTYLHPCDVLIARMPDPIGRACIFPGVGQPAVTAVDVMVWRSDRTAADPQWLVGVLNSEEARKAITAAAGGTTRQRISGGRLKALSVPVPPLAEQRRVVAKLDALSARSKRARAELTRVSALSSAAVEAKISYEMKRVAASAPTIKFGDLLAVLTSGSRGWAQYYDLGDAVFVLAANVRPLRFDPTPRRYIGPPLSSSDAKRSRVEKDDLLLTIVGAGTGDICRVEDQYENYFVCQSVALIRFSWPSTAPFYAYWFNAPGFGRKQIEGAMYGAARPHLSFDQILARLTCLS